MTDYQIIKLSSRAKDISGFRSGRLVALYPIGIEQRQVLWMCQCDCGNEKVTSATKISSKRVQSCGCLQFDTTQKLGLSQSIHGHSRINGKRGKTYSVWTHMKARCNNKKHQEYKNYGGRGIKICDRWNRFENFLSDMGEKPDGLSLDRIDNMDGYYKENCRWATPSEQSRNRRVVKLTIDMVRNIREDKRTHTVIAGIYGISASYVSNIKTRIKWKEL